MTEEDFLRELVGRLSSVPPRDDADLEELRNIAMYEAAKRSEKPPDAELAAQLSNAQIAVGEVTHRLERARHLLHLFVDALI